MSRKARNHRISIAMILCRVAQILTIAMVALMVIAMGMEIKVAINIHATTSIAMLCIGVTNAIVSANTVLTHANLAKMMNLISSLMRNQRNL